MFFVVQVVVGTAAAVIISSFKFLRVAGSFAYPTLWHIIDLHTRWQTCMNYEGTIFCYIFTLCILLHRYDVLYGNKYIVQGVLD